MMVFLTFNCFMQNVKAYLRRGTARESLLLYKEAIKGESYDFFHCRTNYLKLHWLRSSATLSLHVNVCLHFYN